VCECARAPLRLRPGARTRAGFMGKFQEEVTQPIASVLFPTEGEWLDEHHSFSVRYKAGEDLGLDMHTDDSDVTFNVCLGKPGFTAAGLTFCGIMGRPDHRVFRLVPDRTRGV